MNYKVGDRVKCICDVDDNEDIVGKKGKIVNIQDLEYYEYGVEFDEEIEHGHDAGDKGKKGHCWFMGDDDIEPVKDKVKTSNKRIPKPDDIDVCGVISTFIKDDRIFTKYDVTKQLRHNGFMAIHQEVRKLVDDNLNLPMDWCKFNLDSYGNPEVFCPDRKSIDQYDPNGIPEFDVNTKPVVKPNDVVQKTQAPKKVTSTKSLFDVRDRYSVKAKVTRDAGFNAGDVLFISTNNSIIEIMDRPKTNAKKVTVDCYYNIRVPKKVFEKSFNSVPLSINVTSDKNKITITEN